MSPYRLTMTQLLLLTALCGLALGLYTTNSRHGNHQSIQSIVFSPDGSFLVACYATGGVRIWDLRGRGPLAVESSLGNDEGSLQMEAIRFVNETQLALLRLTPKAKTPVELLVWDIQSDESVTTLALAEHPSHWGISRSENLLVTKKTANNHVELRNIESGREVAGINLSQAAAGDLSNAYDYDLQVVDNLLVVRYWGTSNGETRFLFYDLATGQPLPMAAEIVSRQVPFAISADGKRLACISLESELKVWNLESEKLDAVFDVSHAIHINRLALSSDGDIVVCSMDGMHSVWSVSDEKHLRELQASKTMGPWYEESTGAIISPGKRWIAATQNDTVILWDVETLRPRYRLPVDRRFMAFVLFSAAWIAWGITWGMLSRRERRRQGQRSSTTVRYSARPTSLAMAELWHNRLVRFTLISSLIAALAIYLGFAPIWAALGLLHWFGFIVTYSTGVVVCCLVIFLLLLVLRKIHEGVWGPNAFPTRRATQAARCLPRTATFENVTLCYYGQSSLEPVAEQAYMKAAKRFASLVDSDLETTNPLLVLCFETPDMLNRYEGKSVPWAGHYRTSGGSRQAIVCEAHCLGFLREPVQVFQCLLGDYFFQEFKDPTLRPSASNEVNRPRRSFFSGPKMHLAPAWIRTGLGWYLAADQDGNDLWRVHRWLRASDWYGDRNATGPWAVSDQQFLEKSLRTYELEAFRESLEFIAQCASLTAFLTETDDSKKNYAIFIRDLKKGQTRKTQTVKETFERNFGFSFDELFQQWREWLDHQELQFHACPPPAIQRHLSEQIVPILRFGESMPTEQKRAIWSMASGGYLPGVELLVQIAADDDSPIREDALWALGVISGHQFGSDVQQWQFWWNQIQLSREAVLMDDDLSYDAVDIVRHDAESDVVVAELADPATANPRVVVRRDVLERITTRTAEESSGTPTGSLDTRQPKTPPDDSRATEHFTDVPPKRLQSSWALLTVAGVVAICWSTASIFVLDGFATVFSYYGIGAGVFSLCKGTGRDVRGISTAAKLLVVCIFNCNFVSFALGIILSLELRLPHLRRYLDSHGR